MVSTGNGHDGSEQVRDITSRAEEQITDRALTRLEHLQDQITSEVDVPCKYVVDDGAAGETILQTADAENCDLICAPFETKEGTVDMCS